MRLYEIDKQISEDMICEGLMDSIRQYVGDKVTNAVSVVNNTASAMIVIYKVASNPEYLDTITFLLKKAIKQKIKIDKWKLFDSTSILKLDTIVAD